MVETTRRRVLAAGALGAAALPGAAMGMGTRPKKTSATFVLVPGAWCGGWIWRRVADRLRANGHRVFTPSLAGLAERSHLLNPSINLTTQVTDVVNVIKWEELSSVVLVGHSYGGMVVSGVTEKVPDGAIRSIVYLDAAVPNDGQCLYDYVGAPTPKEDIIPPPHGETSRTTLLPADAAMLARLLTPQSNACFTEKVHLTGARDRIPFKTFIAAKKWPPPRPDQANVDKLKNSPQWRYEELDCGHNTMLELPEETTAALERAAIPA